MKMWIAISTLFLTNAVSYGQAAPTAVASPSSSGSVQSWIDGTVHYALTASESVQIGYFGSGNVTESTNLSGNVGYVSTSKNLPFSMVFAGGVLFGNQSGQGTTTYQNVAVSQGLIKGRWIFGVSDSFSYLPQSPTTGWSGIPGVGDIGSQPISGPAQGPAGGVLTFSGNRISNALSGSVERRLTGATSVSGSGNWMVLHFLDRNSGLDTTQTSGQVALNHRIDGRSSVSGNAVYSIFDTTGNNFLNLPGNVTFQTKGLNLQYQRMWTRSLSMNASAGPQWISSSGGSVIPSRLNLAADIGFTYTRRLTNTSIHYGRGVNGGSGVQAGALSDSIMGSIGRPLGRNWMGAVTGSYVRTSGLLTTTPASGTVPASTNGATQTFYGGAQLTRGFGRAWSGFLSYSAQDQSINSASVGQNAFSGFSQTFGIGITFAPRSTRLGEF
ncbi:MAG: hypothetical protein JWQ42_903 [Edaphobacter sp.]|nr:hypothetical protein [Edaphobacter sp.]